MILRWGRGIAAGLLLVALLGSFAWWWRNLSVEAVERATSPPLLAVARPVDPAQARALTAGLRRAVLGNPIDQDLVDRFYTTATINDLLGPAAQAQWRGALTRLGWRSTPTQQNLLMAAASAQDLRAILDRTDGLLRREQLLEQIIVLLYLVEKAPELHDLLVTRLAQGAPWRQTFFADPRGVDTPVGRQARLRTLTELLDRHVRLTRTEVTPLLAAMGAADEVAPAYRLWQRLRAQAGGGGMPTAGQSFDPDFTSYLALHAHGTAIDSPFEWAALSGGGYSADIARDGLTLRWDGSGLPVLLRQTFRAVRAPYQLELTGTGAVPGLLKRVEAVLTCPGAAEMPFDRIGADQGDSLVIRTEGAVGCDYPTLVMRAQSGMVSEPVEASLSSVRARPVRG